MSGGPGGSAGGKRKQAERAGSRDTPRAGQSTVGEKDAFSFDSDDSGGNEGTRKSRWCFCGRWYGCGQALDQKSCAQSETCRSLPGRASVCMFTLTLVFSINTIACSSCSDGFCSKSAQMLDLSHKLHSTAGWHRRLSRFNQRQHKSESACRLHRLQCSCCGGAGMGESTQRNFDSTPGRAVHKKDQSRATLLQLPEFGMTRYIECSWGSSHPIIRAATLPAQGTKTLPVMRAARTQGSPPHSTQRRRLPPEISSAQDAGRPTLPKLRNQ